MPHVCCEPLPGCGVGVRSLPFPLLHKPNHLLYNTRDAEKDTQDCTQPIWPKQGMRVPQHILVVKGPLMSFQHYPASSTSRSPSVLTGSQRSRQQEAERQPHPQELFVASNPSNASVGDKGTSVVCRKVCRYLRIRELVLKGLHVTKHNHRIEKVVILKRSPCGCPESRGYVPATHEVRAHAVTCTTDAYGFHQVPGDIQPVPTVLGYTQDAHVHPRIPGLAKIAVDSIDLVDTAMTQLDTINTGYRQTLNTFSAAINGITRVCHPN